MRAQTSTRSHARAARGLPGSLLAALAVGVFAGALVGSGVLGSAGCTSSPAESPDAGDSADLGDPPCSCAVGSKRCTGGRVAVCEQQGPGCASWGPAVACPSGMCAMDSCVASCQDGCSAGASRCSGDAAVEVCRIGASGCLEWVKQGCPAQNFCDPGSGVCAPSVPCDACPAGYLCSRSGTCTGGDPTMLGLDVKTARLAGKVTLNGADPSNGPDCVRRPGAEKARVLLRETSKGYTFALPMSCSDAGFTFAGTVYPGAYQVTVQGSSDGYRYSDLPLVGYVAEPMLVVAGDVSGKVLDVKTVRFNGKVTLNGADPSNGPDCARRPASEKARVLLTETTRGYSFTLPMSCSDAGFTFGGTVYPGTYRVMVQGSSDGYRYSELPLVGYVADPMLAVAGDVSGKVLDVKTVRFNGKVTMNGADPSNGPDCTTRPASEKARVTLTETTRGYSFTLPMGCSDAGFTFGGTVYPGTYRVMVQGSSDGYRYSELPLVGYVADPMLAVAADVSGKVLDIKTVRFGGKVTMNGADPSNGPDCTRRPASEKARVTLSETTQGTRFVLPMGCSDAGFTFGGAVYPGTYQVVVQGSSDGYRYSDLPLVGYVGEAALLVNSDTAGKTLDVKTVRVGGKVTLNALDPVNGPDCARLPGADKARVNLTEITYGYSFSLPMSCSGAAFTFSGAVYPGVYRAAVQGLSDGGRRYSELPLESYVVASRIQIP
ncbi:MAG: hypothetical protein U1A78_07280 [Polyangia bacterium]